MQDLILGALQGVFEWLPISSEGIVSLLGDYFGSVNPVDMALFLHAGTLLATLVYFRRDIREIIHLQNKKLLRFLLIGTLVSLPLGFVLYQFLEGIAGGDILLLLVGVGLLITSLLHNFKERRFSLRLDTVAVITGVLQGLAVIPGLSRSGSTIFGLSLSNLSNEDILKFSYLLSIPAVAASSGYVLLQNPMMGNAWTGLLASFVVGYFSLKYLMKLSMEMDFAKFTLAFGVLCLLGAVISWL